MCPGEPPLGPCQATRRIKGHATPGVPGKGEGTAKPLRGGVAFGCGSSGVASWVKEGSAGPVKLAPPFSDSVTDGLPPLRASNPTTATAGVRGAHSVATRCAVLASELVERRYAPPRFRLVRFIASVSTSVWLARLLSLRAERADVALKGSLQCL